MRFKIGSLIVIVVLSQFLNVINFPAHASKVEGLRPYYSGVNHTPLDLYSLYPEAPVSQPLDVRVSPSDYNNISTPGLMVRTGASLFHPFKYQGIIGDSGVCNSTLDTKCATSKSLSLTIDFPPCESVTQTDCISRFAVETSPGYFE